MPPLATSLAGLLVVLLSYQCAPAAGRRLPLSKRDGCHQSTWQYKQSALESAWFEQVHKWTADTPESQYCEFKKQFDAQVDSWLGANAQLMASQRTHLAGVDAGVFSSFVTTYTCHGGVNETFESWIEPLAFSLRYPKSHCGNNDDIISRAYLLIASGHEHPAQHASMLPVGAGHKFGHRAYLFDFGASLWSVGGGGPSQSWVITAYGDRGIHFDRIMMWEATTHTGPEVFEEVPRDLHAVYQYMIITVSSDVNDPGNPLNILKRITTPEDFVVVKMDIDNIPIETALMNQILHDPEIHTRVDEFFYEHHVNFEPMRAAWGVPSDDKQSLADSYDIFLRLRKLGIRSHGWP